MEEIEPTESHAECNLPETLPVRLETIPKTLTDIPQWVCWKWERDARDNLKKPLYNARTGTRASHSDPASWSSFRAAQNAYETGSYAGVGLVLTAAIGLVAIDIDHCIDATGQLDATAQAIITFLDTYAEYSPSGTGIHLFVCGILPDSRRKRGRYEMYEDKRYITVTGHSVTTNLLPITQAQDRLVILYDRIFAESRPITTSEPRRQQATRPAVRPTVWLSLDEQAERIIAYGVKTNENFRRHFSGDPTLWGSSGKYRSKSEADWQLCLLLAYRTYARKDEPEIRIALIDAIVRKSGLFDEKWDAPRGESTYGRKTIVKAIAENDKSVETWQHRQP